MALVMGQAFGVIRLFTRMDVPPLSTLSTPKAVLEVVITTCPSDVLGTALVVASVGLLGQALLRK